MVQPQKIGYARVSTYEQNLDLQIDALKKAGCTIIYEEKTSSVKNKPELEQCLKALRKGDVLVVWRLDRLSRSLSELLATVSGLAAANIGFESLTEKIDTTSATGNLVFQLFAALAEFERNVISERTKAGLRAARARGKKGGRPSKLTDKQVKEVQALAKNPNISITQIARLYSVSRSTIYKAINQEKTQ